MTAKEDFLNMPFKDRECEVELYEDCRTRKLFEHCGCIPWEILGYQVTFFLIHSLIHMMYKGTEICNPKGRDCIEKTSAKTFNCSTTCVGIYADVQWVGKTIEEDTVIENL